MLEWSDANGVVDVGVYCTDSFSFCPVGVVVVGAMQQYSEGSPEGSKVKLAQTSAGSSRIRIRSFDVCRSSDHALRTTEVACALIMRVCSECNA